MNAHTPETHRTFLRLLFLFALACASAPAARAQVEIRRPQDRAVARVQEAVRARILRDRGGRDEYVVFNDDAARAHIPNSRILIGGTGAYFREGRGGRERREEFRYSAAYSPRDNRVERIEYQFEEGGERREVPRWAVGTFRGTTDSGESELTIHRDGTATITSLRHHTMFSGRYADGVLTFDWGSFRVEREAEGIRTVQINNRRNQTSYRRVN